jgi:hypothetical protein
MGNSMSDEYFSFMQISEKTSTQNYVNARRAAAKVPRALGHH